MNKEVLRGLGLSACHRHTANWGVLGGMLPQEIFEKRHALRSILVHFWPCTTCIILYQYHVLVMSIDLVYKLFTM